MPRGPIEFQGEDVTAYNDLARKIRSRNGLRLHFRRDNFHALSLSYTATEPNEAHRVVSSAVSTLLELNKEETERRLQTNITFLEKELETSKRGLRDIEQKLLRVKNGLPPSVVEQHEQGYLARMRNAGLDPYEINSDGVPSTGGEFGKSLSELKFSLVVAEKEYSRQAEAIKSGSYLDNSKEFELLLEADKDPIISQTLSSILEKERAKNGLLLQGYRAAHPLVANLDSEIRSLNDIKRKRIEELKSEGNSQELELARLRLEQRARGTAPSEKE